MGQGVALTRYIWRNGRFEDRDGNPMDVPERDNLVIPMVQSDIEPYQSVVSGKWVTSRSERRNDLAATGCVPYEPPANAPRGLTNPKFAAKHNAMHLLTEEARDKHKLSKKAIAS